jgi:hypothetical protein
VSLDAPNGHRRDRLAPEPDTAAGGPEHLRHCRVALAFDKQLAQSRPAAQAVLPGPGQGHRRPLGPPQSVLDVSVVINVIGAKDARQPLDHDGPARSATATPGLPAFICGTASVERRPTSPSSLWPMRSSNMVGLVLQQYFVMD